MAFGHPPGPEGAGRSRHLHPQPWPQNPDSQGGLPGPLGRFSDNHLASVAELMPRRPVRPLTPTAEGTSRPLRTGEALMARLRRAASQPSHKDVEPAAVDDPTSAS